MARTPPRPVSGNQRKELVDGEVVITSTFSCLHQRIVREILLELHSFVRVYALGEVLLSPSGISLAGSILHPDMVVAAPTAEGPPSSWGAVTHLLLVIEVADEETAQIDTCTKRACYQRALVPEYWVADPMKRVIYRWFVGRPAPERASGVMTWRPSQSAPPLTIDVRQIFARSSS